MKNLSNLLGIILISVSIVSCGGEENKESTESSINQDQKLEEEKEYPYNVKWISDVSPGDIEIILRQEAECKEIRGMANEVENYGEWKKMMTKMCENKINIE